MSALLHIFFGNLIRRSADWASPRFARRYPRLARIYEFVGRCAAIGLLVLIGLVVLVALPLGFISWLMS